MTNWKRMQELYLVHFFRVQWTLSNSNSLPDTFVLFPSLCINKLTYILTYHDKATHRARLPSLKIHHICFREASSRVAHTPENIKRFFKKIPSLLNISDCLLFTQMLKKSVWWPPSQQLSASLINNLSALQTKLLSFHQLGSVPSNRKKRIK